MVSTGPTGTGRHGAYRITKKDDSKFMGIRCEGQHLFCSDGTMGRVVLKFGGLSEHELPKDKCPSGILVAEVKGLCYGGGELNPDANEIGYIYFTRNDVEFEESTEVRFFTDTINYSVLPFIKKKREQHGWEDGMELGPDDEFVWWLDGALPQVKEILQESRQSNLADLKVTVCKHTSSCSETTQACDCSTVFRDIKSETAKRTAKNRPVTIFCSRVEATFKELEQQGLNLLAAKLEACKDHVVCYPTIITQAATPEAIRDGFVVNAMRDSEQFLWPDLNKMLATMRRDVTEDEMSLIMNTMKELVTFHLEHGRITENYFDELGYPPDLDADGNEVRTNHVDKVTSIWWCRALCLTHEAIRKERRAELAKIEAVIREKENEERRNRKTILDGSAECVAVLQRATGTGTVEVRHLARPTGKQLKHFIHARKFREASTPRGWGGWPKKGKEENVQNDERCLLSLALECLSKPVILTLGDTQQNDQERQIAPAPNRVSAASIEGRDPSSFLRDQAWVNQARSSLRGVVFPQFATQLMQKNGNLLAKILRQRLDHHISQKLQGKRNHYAMKWTRDNVSRMAALLSLAGHVREDLATANGQGVSLFHDLSENFVRVVGDAKLLNGTYLFYDFPNGCFIRSGTAVGATRSLQKRIAEHAKNAKEGGTNNKFYSLFPTRDCQKIVEEGRRGYFEDLVQLCGLSFCRDSSSDVDVLCSLDSEQGLFAWDKNTINYLEKAQFGGGNLRERQLTMLGYLFELSYDLLIAPEHNVSRSGGFEAAMGAFPS